MTRFCTWLGTQLTTLSVLTVLGLLVATVARGDELQLEGVAALLTVVVGKEARRWVLSRAAPPDTSLASSVERLAERVSQLDVRTKPSPKLR